ncbi:hypothetical protein D1872_305350 [compost metagenome]
MTKIRMPNELQNIARRVIEIHGIGIPVLKEHFILIPIKPRKLEALSGPDFGLLK